MSTAYAPRPASAGFCRAAIAAAIWTMFCAMRAEAASIMRPSSCAAPRPSRAASSSAARIRFARSISDAGGVNTSFASGTCEGWMAHLPSHPSAAARRAADLGQQHDVETMPRLFHHVHDVAIHVMRVDAVDADADRLAALPPGMLQQARDHVLAGLLLVGGRDGVLEVEEHVVRFALQRLAEQGGVRAGDRELAALQPGRGRVVAGEAHALATLRGWVVLTPGWDCASGVTGGAVRTGSGAAVRHQWSCAAATAAARPHFTPTSRIAISAPAMAPASINSFRSPRWPMRNSLPASRARPAPSARL